MKEKKLETVVYPILLFLLPFWNVNQGLDFADVGYNMSNFAYYETLNDTWKLGTYLANELGHFLMDMPGGATLLGMNLYTTLLISVTALTAYYFCLSIVPPSCVFLGEVIAIFLCWCPSVILYNYLTYLLMTVMVICLLKGVLQERKGLLVGAGILLGCNVFVRFSNLAEIAFILIVWYAVWLKKERTDRMGLALQKTGWCLLGFFLGFLGILLTIWSRFGLEAYKNMLMGMQNIESNASGYSVWDMLWSPMADYLSALQWNILLLCYVFAGILLFRFVPKKWEAVKKLFFLAGLLLFFRFAWGHSFLPGTQTMYDLNYYSYNAVYIPTAVVLLFTVGMSIYRLWNKEYTGEEKTVALAVLLLILITPLGSNNKLHPIINNLFLVLPFTFAYGWELWKQKSFPVKAVLGVFFLFFVIQTGGFGILFSFGDGSYAEKRDTRIEESSVLRGIDTTRKKAETVEALSAYFDQFTIKPPIFSYGNLPGMPYYLGGDAAASSTWPDLQSFSMADYEADFTRMSIEIDRKRPVFFISRSLDEEDRKEEKYILLETFLKEQGYQEQMSVHDVSVYY